MWVQKKSRVAEGGGCDKKSMATNTGNERCLRRGLGEAKLLTLSFLMCRYAGATEVSFILRKHS